MADQLLPDVGEQFRLWALSRPAIVAIVGDRISVKLTGVNPSIRYAVASGTVLAPASGDPLLQVECWGTANAEDDGTASQLARTVIADLPTFIGSWAGGNVAGADAGYPIDSPDPTTNRPRQIVQIRLVSHAAV